GDATPPTDAAPPGDATPPGDAGPPGGATPPVDLAAPVDPASSASLPSLAARGTKTPPWAPIPSEPRAPAKDAAGAAIPATAFPAPTAPATNAAGAGTPAARGGGQDLIGVRRAPTAAHRPAPARNAQVSGRPPWEPAPQPESELPWAQAPAPPRGETGSLPKREQTRPARPCWDALAEDAWPGGPRGAALHPPVPPPADRNQAGLAARGSAAGAPAGAAGAPAMGARPATRPLPAARLVPTRPDS